MLEFRMLSSKYGQVGALPEWYQPIILPPVSNWLDDYMFRINGVIYREYNEEFIEAYNKERMWGQLNDNI